MFTRLAVFIVMASASAQIWAFPLGKLGCNPTGYERGLNELVQRVSVIERDDRVALSEFGRVRAWDEAKIRRVQKVVGKVRCPGSDFGNGGTASAFLVGTDLTLATSAHTFIDERGRKRSPLNECYFENFANPPQRTFLSFDDGFSEFGTQAPYQEQDRDWAIVRLRKKIVGAEPFRVDLSGVSFDDGSQYPIINVSKVQSGMANQVAETELVAQACSNKDLYSQSAILMTDCDSSYGITGSPALRDMNGQLVAVGIMGWGAEANQANNGRPFNQAAGIATKAIGIDLRIIQVINRIYDRTIRTASAAK